MRVPRIQRESLIAPALAAGVLAVLFAAHPILGIVLALFALVAIFTVWPMLGWTLVVATYPFIYLQLFIGRTVNVPYVDVLAMATALGLSVRMGWAWWKMGVRPTIGRIPGLLPFACFIAAASLSLINGEDLGLGIKFLFRPLTFFYLMYIVLPAVVIDRPRRLFTTFRVLFCVGLLAAAMGIASVVFPPEPGAFRRAVPIAIYGMYLLGTNHNLIAEVLTSIVPIGALLALFSQGTVRRWYTVGTVFLAIVTLLTFSRNGWLTLAVEGIVLLVALAHLRGIAWKRIISYAAAVVAVVLLAIGVFSMTSVAQSSNANRLRLTAIALEQFAAHPIVGAGVGTFQEAVARDRWYIADFGQPQEAHGLVQKLLAETGILGLAAFLVLLGSIVRAILHVYRRASVAPQWRLILLALLCATFGSIVFQLFNTSYFVSKLWLPLGIAVAAARLAERGIALRAGKA